MAKIVFCWRCHMDMPMLDEEEWLALAPLMTFETKPQALAHYEELTGHEETNFNALWHHRISLYGPPCSQCGKPLRTPKAKWCAACGEADSSAAQTTVDDVEITYTQEELIDVLNAHLTLAAALIVLDVRLGHRFMIAKKKVQSVDDQPGIAEGLMLKFFKMGMHESVRVECRIEEPRPPGIPTISDGLDDAFMIGQLACQKNVAFDTKFFNRLRGRKGPLTELPLLKALGRGLKAHETLLNRVEDSA